MFFIKYANSKFCSDSSNVWMSFCFSASQHPISISVSRAHTVQSPVTCLTLNYIRQL